MVLHKYTKSKFKRFITCSLFATISILSLILCIYQIHRVSDTGRVILPFAISIFSYLVGFGAMIRKRAEKSKAYVIRRAIPEMERVIL